MNSELKVTLDRVQTIEMLSKTSKTGLARSWDEVVVGISALVSNWINFVIRQPGEIALCSNLILASFKGESLILVICCFEFFICLLSLSALVLNENYILQTRLKVWMKLDWKLICFESKDTQIFNLYYSLWYKDCCVCLIQLVFKHEHTHAGTHAHTHRPKHTQTRTHTVLMCCNSMAVGTQCLNAAAFQPGQMRGALSHRVMWRHESIFNWKIWVEWNFINIFINPIWLLDRQSQ